MQLFPTTDFHPMKIAPKGKLVQNFEAAPRAANAYYHQQPYTGIKGVEVFAITELLENILNHLPPDELLLAQGVCRTFRDTIRSSIKLQRALFFKPRCLTRADRETHHHFLGTGPHNVNHLVCPDWTQEFSFGHWKLSGMGTTDRYSHNNRVPWSNRMLPVLQIPLFAERMEEAVFEGGSWRGMYLSTLPCEVIVRSMVPNRTFQFRRNLGELIDTLDENYERVVAQSKFPETWTQAMAGRKWKATPARERD